MKFILDTVMLRSNFAAVSAKSSSSLYIEISFTSGSVRYSPIRTLALSALGSEKQEKRCRQEEIIKEPRTFTSSLTFRKKTRKLGNIFSIKTVFHAVKNDPPKVSPFLRKVWGETKKKRERTIAFRSSTDSVEQLRKTISTLRF